MYEMPPTSRWRARYMQGMGDLERNLGIWPGARIFKLNRNNFLLAYQGEDDTQLQRYSAFLGELLGARGSGAGRQRASTLTGIKVRFIRKPLSRLHRGALLRALDHGARSGTSSAVYHSAPVADAFTGASRKPPALHTLRAGRETATQLFADGLDAIVYPEVGMGSLTYELAPLPGAVRFAGWGAPSPPAARRRLLLQQRAVEPGDASNHYVERLIALPGLV